MSQISEIYLWQAVTSCDNYITPLKATHLTSVRKSNAPPNTMSDVSIANRGLRTKDLRVFLLVYFMGFLPYSFMVWWLRALNRASRASNPMRMYCWYIFVSSCTSFVLRGARATRAVRDSLPSNFLGLKCLSNSSDTFIVYTSALVSQIPRIAIVSTIGMNSIATWIVSCDMVYLQSDWMYKKELTADHGTWAVKKNRPKTGQGSRSKNRNKVPVARFGERVCQTSKGGDSRWAI